MVNPADGYWPRPVPPECQWHQLNDENLKALHTIGLEDATIGAIVRYVNYHVKPGSFLSALVSNDLVLTFGCADDNNGRLVRQIVQWFYNHPVGGCWHGQKNFQDWLLKASCKAPEPAQGEGYSDYRPFPVRMS